MLILEERNGKELGDIMYITQYTITITKNKSVNVILRRGDDIHHINIEYTPELDGYIQRSVSNNNNIYFRMSKLPPKVFTKEYKLAYAPSIYETILQLESV